MLDLKFASVWTPQPGNCAGCIIYAGPCQQVDFYCKFVEYSLHYKGVDNFVKIKQ